MGFKVVDNQYHRSVHRCRTRGNGDVVGPSFGGDVVIHFHIALRRENGHAPANVGLGSGAVHGHGEGSVHAHSAYGSCRRRTDGPGDTRGIDPDDAPDVLQSAGTVDGGDNLAAEVGACGGHVGRSHSAGQCAVDRHHLAEVQIAMDGQAIGLLHRACQDRVHFREHQCHGDTGVHAHRAAAHHQGQNPDGRLVGAFGVVELGLTVVALHVLILLNVEIVVGDVQPLTFVQCSGHILHPIFAGLNRSKLPGGFCPRGGFHHDGAACAQCGVLIHPGIHIGMEDTHADAQSRTGYAADGDNAGGDIGIHHIPGTDADVSGGDNPAAGVNDGRHGVFIALAVQTGRGTGVAQVLLDIFHVLRLGHIPRTLVIDGFVFADNVLPEVVVVPALGALAVSCQQSRHFSVGTLLALQGCRSGIQGIVAGIRGEACLYLFLRVHARIDAVMGILGHFIAQQNHSYRQGHTGRSRAADVGSHAQDVPIGTGFHSHIPANHQVVSSNAGFHGGIGHIHKGDDSAGAGARNGHTGHDGVNIEGVLRLDGHISRRPDLHEITGVGLGDKLGDDHVEGTAYRSRSGTGNARGVGGDKLPGGGQDFHVSGKGCPLRADDCGSIRASFQHMSKGFVFKIGDQYNGRTGCGAAAGNSRSDVIQVCVRIGRHLQVPGLLNRTRNSLRQAAEYQHVYVACNACAGAGAEAQGQQEHLIPAVRLNQHVSRRFHGLGVQFCPDGLVVDQGDHSGSQAEGSRPRCKRSRCVNQITVVFCLNQDVAGSGLALRIGAVPFLIQVLGVFCL